MGGFSSPWTLKSPLGYRPNIGQNVRNRRPFGAALHAKAPLIQDIGRASHVVISHDEVEVLVVTRLLAHQRVYTPPTEEPHVHVGCSQPPDDLENVVCRHHRKGNVADLIGSVPICLA
jgi:UDP-N-acetylenolpyruvoylglucosamine reductase